MSHCGRAVVLAVVLGIAPRSARAAIYEFEGMGVKEVARGGAAIADVDDWTSVYWNPAGLAAAAAEGRRELGMDISGGIISGRDTNSLSAPFGPIFSKGTLSSPYILGDAGLVVPVNKDLGLGFGFYIPLLQGSNFEDAYNGSATSYKAATGFLTSNVSAGYRVLPEVLVGAGLNLVYVSSTQDWDLTVPAGVLAPFYLPDHMGGGMKGHGSAFEGVFGARYDPVPAFSVGAVYRSGARVTVKGKAHAYSQTFGLNESSDFSMRFNHPPTFGAGVAWRPTGRLTWSLDLVQTCWRQFRNAISYAAPGVLLADKANTLDWHDSYRIRTGIRARAAKATDVLFGYTFDPSAADPGSLDFSNTIDITSHKFYAGSVHRWNPHVQSSLAAIYGAGTRNEGGIGYRSGGWQLKLGGEFFF